MLINERGLYQQVVAALRERRMAIGMTQAELAAASRVRRTSITNIESGRQKAPLHVLYDICVALGIETASVLPQNSAVELRDTSTYRVNSPDSVVPPRTAEFLKQLMDE